MSNSPITNQPFVAVINTVGMPPVQPHLHERLKAERRVIELENAVRQLLGLLENATTQEQTMSIINNAKELLK